MTREWFDADPKRKESETTAALNFEAALDRVLAAWRR